MPFGTLNAASNAIELHPKALIGAGWDDDPYLDGSGNGDAFVRGLAALEVRFIGTGPWRADAEAGVEGRRYAQADDRNWIGGSAHAGLMRHTEDSYLQLRAGTTNDREPIATLPEQVERQRTDAEISGSQEWLRWRMEARLTWDRLDYLEDAPTFDRNEKDHDRIRLGLSLLHLGADKSLLGATVLAEANQVKPTSSISDHQQMAAQVRWRHGFTERSAAEIRLGGVIRRHDADSPGGQDDRLLVAPTAAAELLWRWESQSHLFLGVETGLADGAAEGSNASYQVMVVTRGLVRLADRLALMHYGHWVQRQDTGALPGRAREERVNMVFRAGPEYRLRQGVGLRTWLGVMVVDSQTGTDTDRHEAAMELVVAF
jgi:hypothetical protein